MAVTINFSLIWRTKTVPVERGKKCAKNKLLQMWVSCSEDMRCHTSVVKVVVELRGDRSLVGAVKLIRSSSTVIYGKKWISK